MRIRTILALAVVTVPTVAVALLLPPPHGGETTAPEAGGGLLLPALKGNQDALAQISITGSDGVTLARTPVPGKPDNGWGLREKGGYPVPPATIQPIIDSLVALHGVAPKTDRPALYGKLGVADPGKDSEAHLITLTDTKGAALGRIVLGKLKTAATETGAAHNYVRVPGNPRVWLAAPSIQLPSETLDWIDRTVVDIDAAKVREVLLTQPGNPPVDFVRFKAGGKLAVNDVPPGGKLKSDTPGADIEQAFSGLELDDVKPETQLGGSAAGTVHVVTFDNVTVDFTLHKDNGQTWATIAADGPKAAQDITARTKGWAYQIPSDRAATLTTTLAALLEAPPKEQPSPTPLPKAQTSGKPLKSQKK